MSALLKGLYVLELRLEFNKKQIRFIIKSLMEVKQ